MRATVIANEEKQSIYGLLRRLRLLAMTGFPSPHPLPARGQRGMFPSKGNRL